MNERKPVKIPDNPAGRRCVEFLYSIAKKMWATGNKATTDFALSNFQSVVTINKVYHDKKFKRTIECDNGSYIIVIYDYLTRTTTAAQIPPNEYVERRCEIHEKVSNNIGCYRSHDISPITTK